MKTKAVGKHTTGHDRYRVRFNSSHNGDSRTMWLLDTKESIGPSWPMRYEITGDVVVTARHIGLAPAGVPLAWHESNYCTEIVGTISDHGMHMVRRSQLMRAAMNAHNDKLHEACWRWMELLEDEFRGWGGPPSTNYALRWPIPAHLVPLADAVMAASTITDDAEFLTACNAASQALTDRIVADPSIITPEVLPDEPTVDCDACGGTGGDGRCRDCHGRGIIPTRVLEQAGNTGFGARRRMWRKKPNYSYEEAEFRAGTIRRIEENEQDCFLPWYAPTMARINIPATHPAWREQVWYAVVAQLRSETVGATK